MVRIWHDIKSEVSRGVNCHGRTTPSAFRAVTLAMIALVIATSFVPPLLVLPLLLLPLFASAHIRRMIDIGWREGLAKTVFWTITAAFVAFVLFLISLQGNGPEMSETDKILVFVTLGLWLFVLLPDLISINVEAIAAGFVLMLILLPAPILTVIGLFAPSRGTSRSGSGSISDGRPAT